MAACSYHALTPATGGCAECGKPICDLCTSRINTRTYCVGCAVGRAPQHPWLAALFSLLVPGMGQLYNGEWPKAILFFLTAPLVLPWILSVVDAANVAARITEGRLEQRTIPTGMLLLALKVAGVVIAVLYLVLAGFLFSLLMRTIAGLA